MITTGEQVYYENNGKSVIMSHYFFQLMLNLCCNLQASQNKSLQMKITIISIFGATVDSMCLVLLQCDNVIGQAARMSVADKNRGASLILQENHSHDQGAEDRLRREFYFQYLMIFLK